MIKLRSPDAVIVETSHSPNARLKPVSLKNVAIGDGFWQSRCLMNRNVTIPSQFQLLESTGRLDNFRRASGLIQKPFQGFVYNDSDVYKWLEAASWTLVSQCDDELYDHVNLVITLISQAQDKDGYLNTYFSKEKIRERWMNLREKHELYCAGHLIQAAIAHHRSTGEEGLITVATRLADHICSTFGPSQVEGTPGHPGIEMALVELYRETNEKKYLQQAGIFIDRRGRGFLGGSEYLLDHIPLRQMDHLAGHAVRALYLSSGATDLALETGERTLTENLVHLWETMVAQQMYVTGGLGSRYEGEAFGTPYELPNIRAYAETCAAIANVMWNWRMLQVAGTARYADLMEWTLFNAVLPGISLDASLYFYVNPMEDNGSSRRQAWFDCACCPPNVARIIAALPGYIFSVSLEGIWLNLYAQSKATIETMDGLQVKLEQNTAYPWDGKVVVKISEILSTGSTSKSKINIQKFSLFLRIPAWLENKKVAIKLNGKPSHYRGTPGSYLEIHRQWKSGDTVEVDFPMDVRFLESHPFVTANVGRLAITRGPLVYCLEAADNAGVNLHDLRINTSTAVESEYIPGMLSGITRLRLGGTQYKLDPDWDNQLYRQYAGARPGDSERKVTLLSIPYFAWANREPGAMAIWHRFK